MPLYNEFQYNEGLYNAALMGVTVYPTDLIVFDGFSLSDGTYMVCADLEDSAPRRDLIEGPVPRNDGMYLTADFWREKFIEARGVVKHTSAANLEAYMETIKKSLRTRAANLDITRNGVVRRYVATWCNPDSTFPVRRHFHRDHIPFVVRFKCNTPFGTDRDYTSSNVSVTSSPESDTVSNEGTIEAEPVFVLVVNAASSVTVLNIGNDQTGEEIEYSGTAAAGDVFVFDGESKNVTKNGVAVDYSGSFPVLDVGSNVIRYTITGTSFDIRATTKWKNRYL